MSSTQHLHSPSYPFSDSSFWEVPRLYKDKIYRENKRPVIAVGEPPRRHVGVSESPKRVTLLDYKSKSSTSVPTLRSYGTRLSPGSSIDMSSSRFSLDGKSLSGSMYAENERPDSIAQNLRAKGSRLMRRHNSKFNLRTMEWVEDTEETWTRSNARHNRIQSAGNGIGIRPEISEPYNFQHLTHTHSHHFQQMSRASHHDLVSEFSAIRAAQAPRRELQGIKAECLQSRKLQSEPTSPSRRSLITPPLSPTKPTHQERAPSLKLHSSPPADYFSQPSPRLYKDRSATLPISPPPRFSSRGAVPDPLISRKETPLEEHAGVANGLSTASHYPAEALASDVTDNCLEYSSIPHAVTTPDNSACTLKSPSFHLAGVELPDVPEEDDDEKSTATGPSHPSTASSGLRHTKSVPSISLSSPRNVKPRDSGSQSSGLETYRSHSEAMLPLVGEPDDDIPIRPRFSRRISLKAQGFDASWEDDIDYCYEHAAEADCDFNWDRVSIKDAEESTNSRVQSILEGDQNQYGATSPEETPEDASHFLPRLETSVPSLYSADSAKSSSLSSIGGPATPSFPMPSPRPHGLPVKSSYATSANDPLSPSFPDSRHGSCTLQEELYENIFSNEHYPEEVLPLQTLRFEPPSSREDSPRSSRSQISKCNSQESFMVSRSSSFRYLRSTESMGSLPDLVYSKSSRDGLNMTQAQAVELAATLKASESFLDLQQNPAPVLRQKTSQSLAKEVARQSMLQKAASFGSFDEEEEHEAEEVVILPSVTHHERSQSAAVSQPTGPTYAQRKRSATSASAISKNRVSYSLFPSPPARTP